MKTVYVHIGTPKTATTHLQYYFARNRERLLADGVYYLTDRQGLTVQGVAVALGFWEEHDQNAYTEDLQWFRGELRKALASPAERILLSTELFCVTLPHRRKMLVRRLHDELKAAGAERIVVVCYLRRQDLFVESWWAHDIAHWGIRPPVRDADPSVISYADYYQLLCDYREIFGDRIVVRPFEKQQLVDGDIVADFHDVLGVPRDQGYSLPNAGTHNGRVRGDVLELVRLYNCSGLGKKRESGFIARRFLTSMFTAEQLAGRTGERFLRLPAAKRKAILRRYAASNRKVAVEFLGRKDGRLFLDAVDGTANRVPVEPLQFEEAAPLLLHMITETFAGVNRIQHDLERRLGEVSRTAQARVDAAQARINALEARYSETQRRCTELEWRLACRSLDGKKLVGWGTSTAFREQHHKRPAPLSYLVDNDAAKWGRKVKGLRVEHPGRLQHEAPADTAIIVYSSAFDAIAKQIAELGPFTVIPGDVFARYGPAVNGPATAAVRRTAGLQVA